MTLGLAGSPHLAGHGIDHFAVASVLSNDFPGLIPGQPVLVNHIIDEALRIIGFASWPRVRVRHTAMQPDLFAACAGHRCG